MRQRLWQRVIWGPVIQVASIAPQRKSAEIIC